MRKAVVMSLGGSLIIPEDVDSNFLNNFKEIILKHRKSHSFVIVCGGGSIARKYISALKKSGKSNYLQNFIGIAITRMNARFMTYFFGKDASEGIPHDIKHVAHLLAKNDIVFCGGLRYAENETSDATAAKIARFLHCNFINLTSVPGLYTSNPLIHRNAKFIPKISWDNFMKRANKIKYRPGQHFVLDQHAAQIIKNSKIKTYILGKNAQNLDNLLSGKKFNGTTIEG
jgi:uridylate kinase